MCCLKIPIIMCSYTSNIIINYSVKSDRVEDTMALICDEKVRNGKQVGKNVQVSATYTSQKWNHSHKHHSDDH